MLQLNNPEGVGPTNGRSVSIDANAKSIKPAPDHFKGMKTPGFYVEWQKPYAPMFFPMSSIKCVIFDA